MMQAWRPGSIEIDVDQELTVESMSYRHSKQLVPDRTVELLGDPERAIFVGLVAADAADDAIGKMMNA